SPHQPDRTRLRRHRPRRRATRSPWFANHSKRLPDQSLRRHPDRHGFARTRRAHPAPPPQPQRRRSKRLHLRNLERPAHLRPAQTHSTKSLVRQAHLGVSLRPESRVTVSPSDEQIGGQYPAMTPTTAPAVPDFQQMLHRVPALLWLVLAAALLLLARYIYL